MSLTVMSAGERRFRVPESDIYIRTYELIGANPVPLPGPEIFTSLQNGVVDGTGAPIFAAVTQKYYETPVKYLSLTEHIYAALLMFMGGELWDGLGPAAQQLVQQAAIEAAAHQRAEAAKLTTAILPNCRTRAGKSTRSTRTPSAQRWRPSMTNGPSWPNGRTAFVRLLREPSSRLN